MSVSAAFKFKREAINFSPDNNTGHIIKTKINCVGTDCKNKDCKHPCNTTTGATLETEGHFTHKPPQDKPSVVVGHTDIEGKPKDQYYVKNNDSTKNIPGKDLEQMTEEDLYIKNKDNSPNIKR